MNYIRHLNAFFAQLKKDDRLTTSHVSLYLALFQYWNFNRFQNPFPVYRTNMMQLSKIGSKNTYHKCLKELHTFGYIRYHPSISRYQPVKISIIRLDTHTQQTNYQQLDLFASIPDQGIQNRRSQIIATSQISESNRQTLNANSPTNTPESIETPPKEVSNARSETLSDSPFTIDHSPPRVPKSSPTSPISDPPHVPKSVPSVKQKNRNKHVLYTPTRKSGKKKPEKESESAQVPNSVHMPTLKEVEEYFQNQQYSLEEARKFYYYNQAKNWILTGSTPIVNWQAIAQKWILNIWQERGAPDSSDLHMEIQNLRHRYLQGEKIAHLLTAEHFQHLQLKLTPDVHQQALHRRMNQLLSSNQHSHLQLYQAYQRNDPSDPLIINDQSNLTLLAMRLALLEHFKKI